MSTKNCKRIGMGSLVVFAAVAAGGLGIWHGHSRAAAEQTAAKVAPASEPHVTAATPVEAGRYLVRVGGCNDCHTTGFAMKAGQIPENDWLLGDAMGHRGPWGTSYASNLRLFIKDMSVEDFLLIMRTRTSRPPMPWPSLHAMSEQDLRSLYAYLKSLKPIGNAAPEFVPPTESPKTPFVSYEPIFPKPAEPAK